MKIIGQYNGKIVDRKNKTIFINKLHMTTKAKAQIGIMGMQMKCSKKMTKATMK